MERLLALDLGDLIGVDGIAFCSRRGELTLRVDRRSTLLAKSLRPPPEKHHGLTDVETRYRHRELDLIANEDARELFITRARVISAIRRFLDERGLHRGRDAGAAAALRRRRGAAVHDPPQRARPRALPADRHRAVPQAADRRRPRARLRDRQGLPQRGASPQAQPRVHDARVVRGLRRLPATSPRAARSWSRYVAHGRSATTGRDRLHAAVAARDAAPTRSSTRTGIDILRSRDRDALAARDARARACTSPTDDTWPQLVDELLSKHVEPTLIAADVPARLPGRALAARQAPPLASPGWSSASRPSSAGWRSPTRSPSSTIPTSSARASRQQRALRRRRRRGGAALRRGVHRRRSSTGCRRPAGSASGSTAW